MGGGPQPERGDQSPLADADVLSSTDAWAVGYGNGTMAIHWDGSSWRNVPTPDPPSPSSRFNGVTAASSSDVWAVGDASQDASHIRTLIEHWDGSRWTIVPSPDRPGVPNTLPNQVADRRRCSPTAGPKVPGRRGAPMS